MEESVSIQVIYLQLVIEFFVYGFVKMKQKYTDYSIDCLNRQLFGDTMQEAGIGSGSC